MTARRLNWTFLSVAGLLGAAHISLTPLAYASWTLDALWFLGSGFAIVIASAANAVGLTSPDPRNAWAMLAINLMMAGFFAAAWSVLPGPQVIVGGAVFLGLAGCTLARRSERALAG
ncbi:hypothetical protein [Blastomonas sp.]|uniref:hypothetical protein n=1 Tax=Blastomonas sp. TaxID=1909299 RepID=UPI002637C5D3|nr:hypothetical protein [Blastomonas sp.]MDM7955162.1 hypothetical protein [Blastomonas sp.]